ncbi:hypothetical protein [Quadrisphaera sp. INWT6]|uniref:hypothetical protein n=1 Tax=Quadrisphaera sp. INWT6 TaxID=2596917 RepID=UPI0018927036|nr:hypothetical protein [Quadrisphaera sp. INWT6]MBF5082736.1 hypothetical protein [Quadrisphaera sp. INWT6]
MTSGQRVFWAVVGLAVVGLVALFFVLRHGGELELEGGVTAFTLPPSAARADGGIPAGGTLVISPGGCLAVTNGRGGAAFLALPSGTRADASGTAVVTGTSRSTGEEQRYAVGDVIEGSGGQVDDSSWRSRVHQYWPGAPRECLDALTGYVAIRGTG